MSGTIDKSVFKEFNKAAKALIKDLCANFPNVDHYKLISCSFAIVKRLSKKRPQQYFYDYIEAPHGKYILNRDINYFASDEFKSNFWESFTNFIRTQVKALDEQNREAILNHMTVLMAWSKKCQNYRLQKKGLYDESSGEDDDTDKSDK